MLEIHIYTTIVVSILSTITILAFTNDFNNVYNYLMNTEKRDDFITLTLAQSIAGNFYSLSSIYVVVVAGPIAINSTSIFKDVFLTFTSVFIT